MAEPTGARVTITVNGESWAVPAESLLVDILAERGIDPARIAVERNREVVPRSEHAELRACDGDAFEIVHFVGGG